MKFLYLKGIDIFGPFEVDQIVKEDCFSDDLLVCPEDKAEQEAAWKPASFYEEFKSSLEKQIFPVKEDKSAIDATSSISDSKDGIVEESIKAQDLPPLEETETDTDSAEFNDFGPSFKEIMDELSEDEEAKAENEDNEVEDHTFHIERQEDNLLEDLPAHSLLGSEKNNDNQNDPLTVSSLDHSSPLEPDAEKVQKMEDVKPRSTDLLEISNNKIISSSDGRVKKRRQNDLLFILSFIAITIVAIALCLAFFNMMKEGKDAVDSNTNQNQTIDEEQRKTEEISKKLIDISKKPEDVSIATQPEEASINQNTSAQPEESANVEEQVIDIVRNTKVPSKGKTIGEYLEETYGIGYQYSWSAKPFTDKVYIVEFFASQVRSEPYVYLFRVDTDQKKITGALNNITLDLLA